MTTLKRLIGLPVILNGRPSGHVSRVVVTRDGRKLQGVIVSLPVRGNRWIWEKQIRLLGKVSVIAEGETEKLPSEAAFRLFRVSSPDGERLGLVSDVVFDQESMKVMALEISLGPLDDLIYGRWFATSFFVSPSLFGSTGHVTIPEEVRREC